MSTTIPCPRCKGSGEGAAHFLNDFPGAAGVCGRCLGDGEVPAPSPDTMTLGECFAVSGWKPELDLGIRDHGDRIACSCNRPARMSAT